MPDNDEFLPQQNSYLLGHEEAEQVFLNAFNNDKLHNSWLISGIKGIGKATFAYRIARFLLDEKRGVKSLQTDFNSPSNRLISSGSHPDLKVLERDYIKTDREKIVKALKKGEAMSEADKKNLKKSAVINIDDVRTINEFMSHKASNGGWRVVIVDAVDDMNINSANAFLKTLEEPPARSILLLISNNPQRLLPTIKSRCSKLSLKPLKKEIIASLLRRYRPNLTEAEVSGLAEVAGGSIGRALDYADNNALEFYNRLKAIVSAGNRYKLSDLLDWVNNIGDKYSLACELILKFYSENVACSQNVEEMTDAWENTIKVFRQTDSLNMDKKQTLIRVIGNLCKIN